MNPLGHALHMKGDHDGADAILRQALAVSLAATQIPDNDVGAVLLLLGQLALGRGEVKEA